MKTCERWAENVVWQYFSGMDCCEPRLPCDTTQLGRFRVAIGEIGMETIFKATSDTAAARRTLKAQRAPCHTLIKGVGRPIKQAFMDLGYRARQARSPYSLA